MKLRNKFQITDTLGEITHILLEITKFLLEITNIQIEITNICPKIRITNSLEMYLTLCSQFRTKCYLQLI